MCYIYFLYDANCKDQQFKQCIIWYFVLKNKIIIKTNSYDNKSANVVALKHGEKNSLKIKSKKDWKSVKSL